MIRTYEYPHFNFHCLAYGTTEIDLFKFSDHQEKNYEKICSTLNITFDQKINYWLYESQKVFSDTFSGCSDVNCISVIKADDENIGRKVSLSGDPEDEYIIEPNSIHFFYNENKRLSDREDAHIIITKLGDPGSAYMYEGLAMFLEGIWWGIENKAWAKYRMLIDDLYPAIDLIRLDNDAFYKINSNTTLPVAGAWTEFVFNKYGVEKYKQFYCCSDHIRMAAEILGDPLEKIHKEFVSWLKHLIIYEGVFKYFQEQSIEKSIRKSKKIL